MISKKYFRITGEPKYFLQDDMISLLSHPKKLVEHSLNLTKRADAMMGSARERLREDEVYRTLCKSLAVRYPDCKPYAFGSRFSGLTLDNSDFDIFLDCGE